MFRMSGTELQDADLIELLNGCEEILSSPLDYEYDVVMNQTSDQFQTGNRQSYVDKGGYFIDRSQTQLGYPQPQVTSINRLHRRSNTLQPKMTNLNNTNRPSRVSASAMPTHITSQSIVYEDAIQDTSQLESRVKSYELRVKGQIRTIRSLETELNQTNNTLDEKVKLLQMANNRIRMLESRERNVPPNHNLNRNDHLDVHRSVNSKLNNEAAVISKYEEQLQLLESRMQDEQNRRIKSEERSRAFKEYYEKLKFDNTNVEKQYANANKLIQELQMKCARHKKDIKDIMSELSAYIDDGVNKGILIEQQRDRIKKAEKALRTTLVEYSRLREEADFHRKELIGAQSQYKQAQLEIASLRERELARRAELKMYQISSSGPSGGGTSPANNAYINGSGGSTVSRGNSVGSASVGRMQKSNALRPSQQTRKFALSSSSDPGSMDCFSVDEYEGDTAGGAETALPPRPPTRRKPPLPAATGSSISSSSIRGCVSDSEATNNARKSNMNYNHNQTIPSSTYRQQQQLASSASPPTQHAHIDTVLRPHHRSPSYSAPNSPMTRRTSTLTQQQQQYSESHHSDNDGKDDRDDEDMNSSVYSTHSLLGKLQGQGMLSESQSPSHSHSPAARSPSRAAVNTDYNNSNTHKIKSKPKLRSSIAKTSVSDGIGVRQSVSSSGRHQQSNGLVSEYAPADSTDTATVTVTGEEVKWEHIKRRAAADARKEFELEQQQQTMLHSINSTRGISTQPQQDMRQQSSSSSSSIRSVERVETSSDDKYDQLKRMYRRVTGGSGSSRAPPAAVSLSRNDDDDDGDDDDDDDSN